MDPEQEKKDRAKYTETDKSVPEKQVSAKAAARLDLSAGAIAAVKRAIQHQGNQVPSLRATKMNSNYCLKAMRDPRAWEYTAEAAALANANPEANTAAKADIAHGGNCGEHGWVAYHWLRQNATGEVINRASPSYIDHAFCIIGDLKKDTDQDLVVSDAWVNAPKTCLWEDFFAKGPRDQLNPTTMVADGNSYKAAIAAGLKLSDYGKRLIAMADSEEQTEAKLGEADNHFWDHADARASGHQFRYKGPQPAAQVADGAARQPAHQ